MGGWWWWGGGGGGGGGWGVSALCLIPGFLGSLAFKHTERDARSVRHTAQSFRS